MGVISKKCEAPFLPQKERLTGGYENGFTGDKTYL